MQTEIIIENRVGDLDQARRRLGDSGHVRRVMGDMVEQGARVGEQSAKIYAPEDTRRLKRELHSTHARYEPDGAVEASTGQSEVKEIAGDRLGPLNEGVSMYPLRVHEGTGLYGALHHLIFPRRAKAMRFPGRTGLVFAKAVRGQRPQPYMAEAFEDVSAYMRAAADNLVARILDTDR